MIDDATLAEWEQNHSCGRRFNPDYDIQCRVCALLQEIRRLREEREVMLNHPPLYRYDTESKKLELLQCVNCAAHRAALLKYGQHLASCQDWRGPDCTCGFLPLVQQAREVL